MKKQIMIALGLTLMAAPAMAADLSGAWVRDAKASDPNSFPVYWITRDLIAPGGGGNAVIELKQSPTTLEITDPARILRKLPLDGQPHVSKAETGVVNHTVTATLQGDNLVVATVEPYAGLPGGITTNIKDTWALSNGGKTLTVTTVRVTPAATQTSKQVYNKR
jgi:hypothetical protein